MCQGLCVLCTSFVLALCAHADSLKGLLFQPSHSQETSESLTDESRNGRGVGGSGGEEEGGCSFRHNRVHQP